MEESVYSCFDYYSQILMDKYEDCQSKDDILNNHILPFKILDIDINNEEDTTIIYEIPPDFCFTPKGKTSHTFLGQYFKIKKELNYTSERNYENEIFELIQDDDFIKEFFSILSSKTISSYFKAKIKFQNDYEVKFVEGNEEICLKGQYEEFMKDIKKDYKKLKDLIIIKQICYKVPAMTDSLMRIFINPLYEITENIQNDTKQLKSVLRSAIIVLLIHEIATLLKAYPIKNEYPNIYPLSLRVKKLEDA